MAKISANWTLPGNRGNKFDGGRLSKNVASLDDKIRRIITGQFEYHTDVATKYMKDHAPWTDRTGNARSGLFTTTAYGVQRDHWELIMAHSVYYGIYLEVCNSGKYAVIKPTLEYIGPLLLTRMTDTLARIGAYSE